MDIDEMIERLEDLDRSELARLEEALKRRLRELGADGGGGEKPVSGVLECRPHADGTLQSLLLRITARVASRGRSILAVPTTRRANLRGSENGEL